MAKYKEIKCSIYRDKPDETGRLSGIVLGFSIPRIRDMSEWICLSSFRCIAPALCKGLRPGQSRKLVLTQTARGIKLERAKK